MEPLCREDGSPVRPDHVSKLFVSLNEAVGLRRIVLHGLRHTHATHGLAAGVPITVVSNPLGHSRSSFTADTCTPRPQPSPLSPGEEAGSHELHRVRGREQERLRGACTPSGFQDHPTEGDGLHERSL